MLPRELRVDTLFPPPDLARWRALVDADLKGAPFEKRLVTHTYEGIHVQPLYTAATSGELASAIGASGVGAMTRAARPLGNSVRGWDIRQERAEAELHASNAAIREDLMGGATSILLRFDACARAGLDPTDAHGAALAGRDGLSAYTLDDLDQALQGVHVHMISIALESGAAFLPMSAMLAALWERRGVTPAEARGAFSADPLAVLARDGQLPCSLESSMKDMVDLARWTSDHYPHVSSVRVGTAAYHHAGATATQDLAFSIATALEYLRAMRNGGLRVDQAASQMTFSFAVGCGIFLASAKLRAARRLWARVLDACGAHPDSRAMVMHVRPSKRVLATRDPWVNILRNTACVFAASLGGADAISSTPFDAPLGEPSPLGRRLARNTHHLLMEECQLHRICDPLGGSWYIETLTDELCEKAWVILQAIESRGGMARALNSGWVGEQIDQAMQPRIRNISTRKDVILGVSDFPNPAEHVPRPVPVDRDTIVRRAIERLGRTGKSVLRLTAAPTHAPGGRAAWALELARAGGSVGQITAMMTQDDGRTSVLDAPIQVHPYAEPFERLREAAEHYEHECGRRPSVHLVVIGTPAERLARVNFCTNLFESGGFDVTGGESDGSIAGALESLRGFAPHAPIAVICGPDARYPTDVPTLAPALHARGVRTVVLAGNPGANEAALTASGVNRFVYVKCDVVQLLQDLLIEEGVTV